MDAITGPGLVVASINGPIRTSYGPDQLWRDSPLVKSVIIHPHLSMLRKMLAFGR